MDIILKVFLPLSLAVIMFSLGIGLTAGDFGRVVTRPLAFFVGAFGQTILLPIIAFGLAIAFQLPPELAVGLMILSFCPGGVTTNMLSKLALGDVALSVSLTGVISLVSILTVPLLIAFAVGYFQGDDAPPVDITKLAVSMFLITTVPVFAGILFRKFFAELAEKIEPWMVKLSIILFAVIILGALAANWQVFKDNLPVLGPALVLLNVIMILLGGALARLFGLSGQEIKTIAIETGVQNGTLGITMASLVAVSASGIGPYALPSAVYGIIMYLVTIPFVLWVARRG